MKLHLEFVTGSERDVDVEAEPWMNNDGILVTKVRGGTGNYGGYRVKEIYYPVCNLLSWSAE